MLSERLRECGVVGAGGAGFPAYVKAQSRVEYVIANGAECEPLIHKDAELMKHYPAEILAGMMSMMEAVGAGAGKFGVKTKNADAIAALKASGPPARIAFVELGDFYPSGDEYELVYSATGRLIPPAGIPLQVGCVVNNVETLYNVRMAEQGRPVTEKFLSVCGAVKEAKSFWAPVGTPFRDLVAWAGGATVADFGLFMSGIMMGTLTFDLDDVVTMESFSVAALIEGADAAVKAANVELIEIRLAMALGGKAFVTLTGNVAAVEAAVAAGAQVVGQKGMLVNKVVIPHPRAELLNEMI